MSVEDIAASVEEGKALVPEDVHMLAENAGYSPAGQKGEYRLFSREDSAIAVCEVQRGAFAKVRKARVFRGNNLDEVVRAVTIRNRTDLFAAAGFVAGMAAGVGTGSYVFHRFMLPAVHDGVNEFQLGWSTAAFAVSYIGMSIGGLLAAGHLGRRILNRGAPSSVTYDANAVRGLLAETAQ